MKNENYFLLHQFFLFFSLFPPLEEMMIDMER